MLQWVWVSMVMGRSSCSTLKSAIKRCQTTTRIYDWLKKHYSDLILFFLLHPICVRRNVGTNASNYQNSSCSRDTDTLAWIQDAPCDALQSDAPSYDRYSTTSFRKTDFSLTHFAWCVLSGDPNRECRPFRWTCSRGNCTDECACSEWACVSSAEREKCNDANSLLANTETDTLLCCRGGACDPSSPSTRSTWTCNRLFHRSSPAVHVLPH